MLRSWRYRGAGRTLRIGLALAAYRLRRGWGAPRPHAFDLEFGVETVSPEAGTEFCSGAPEGNGYEPVDPVDFARMMQPLPADLAAYTFVDFGSGRGRALLLAAEYNFAAVMGIEYSRALHVAAQQNLAAYARRRHRRQRCLRLEPVWADALAWPLPPTPSVFYFSEPFPEPQMRLMAARLAASLQTAPRPAFVMYGGDRCQHLWRERTDFEMLALTPVDCVLRYRGGA
ncbi:MAG TPA: hypothetical protein VN515_08190 [Terriglobales bacterium]|nr:hypothetical protein [Terriglobales bacterium]